MKEESKKQNKMDNKKENKKMNKINTIKIVKILTIVLAILLITMISFIGIYKINKGQVYNVLKDYTYSKQLKGARTIKLKLNTETKEVIKDSEGNIVETATDEEITQNGYTKEQVPNNSDEVKTVENYKLSKEIIEKRLKSLGIQDYTVSLNETSGEIIIEIPEDETADTVASNINSLGKFEIIDSETKEVLMDNNNIKSSDVLYNTTTSGTTVYLEIAFNKDGKNKLKDMSTTYIETENTNTTDTNNVETNAVEENTATENETETNSADTNTTEQTEETNTTEQTEETSTESEEEKTEKTITMKIDDQEILTTHFDEPITNGKIQLSVGTATADTSTLQDYITQAQNMSVILDNGKLPIQYDLDKNEYILSNINEQDLLKIEIAIAVVAIIAIIFIVIKFKLKGLIAGISYIGLMALLALLIRYANVIVSIESIFGIITMLILDYIFTFILLNNIEKNIKEEKENKVNKATLETYNKFFVRIIPICIMVIVFCFAKWIPISSFGMVSFWGLTLIAIYNAIITRSLLKILIEEK